MLRENFDLPVIGVIEAGVESALSDPAAGRVGIIATRGTVRSHAYQHALALKRTGLIIHAQPAPLLVPIVEEDWIDHPAAELILKTYLEPLIEKDIDTLMLACTHYPLLVPVLRRLLPDDIRLVDSATTCAEHLKQELQRLEMLNGQESDGTLEIHLTDLSEEFETLARRFLSKPSGRIQRAVLA
jgi:glutamate racemase